MRKTLLMTTMMVSSLAIAGAAGAADTSKDTMRNDPAATPKTETQMKSGANADGSTQSKTGVHTDGAMKNDANANTSYRSYSQTEGFKGAIAGGYTAEDLIGTDLVGPNGDTIGEIEDLLIDSNNQVSSVLVDVGGFLGIGEKRVALQLSELTKVDDGFRTAETQEQLEGRVAYVGKDDNWMPSVGDRANDAGTTNR